MTEILTRESFQSLQEELASGTARLQVPRHLARSFFARVSAHSIRQVTGLNYYAQRILVLGTLVAGVLIALVGLYVVGVEFEAMSFMAVPLAGILWTVIAGFTTEMGRGMIVTIILFGTGILVSYFLPPAYSNAGMLLVTSLFLYRLAHLLAEFFLLQLVSSSFEAWEMMEVHVSIKRD